MIVNIFGLDFGICIKPPESGIVRGQQRPSQIPSLITTGPRMFRVYGNFGSGSSSFFTPPSEDHVSQPQQRYFLFLQRSTTNSRVLSNPVIRRFSCSPCLSCSNFSIRISISAGSIFGSSSDFFTGPLTCGFSGHDDRLILYYIFLFVM